MIRVRGAVTGTATANVSLHIWKESHIDGGKQTIIDLSTPTDWCEYYGARVEDGQAIVYKAVERGYMSYHGVKYEPGTMPRDEKWDGRGRECAAGGGLNFSPTPRHTHRFVSSPKHYLECRVALSDMVVHFDGRYPEKICAPAVVAPMVEVDVNGKRVGAEVPFK